MVDHVDDRFGRAVSVAAVIEDVGGARWPCARACYAVKVTSELTLVKGSKGGQVLLHDEL